MNHFLMLETARAVEIGTDDIGNEPIFGMTMPRPWDLGPWISRAIGESSKNSIHFRRETWCVLRSVRMVRGAYHESKEDKIMRSMRNGPLPSTSNLLFVAGNANQWLIAHSTSQRHCKKLSFSVLKHLCQPDLPPHPLERSKQSKPNRALRTFNWLFINQNFKECWW